VAVKTLKTNLSESNLGDCYNEVSVLSHLRHPNLVLFLGAVIDDGPLWIVSEFMEGGSLEDFFKAKKRQRKGKPFRPLASDVLRWLTDFARALCFLHNARPCIIHRDLKPGNLLLSAEGHMKIGDFGLSKIVKGKMQQDRYVMTGRTGTLRYMAPEVMEEESYSEKVDIYSLAFNVWFMCTGERPLELYMRQVTSAFKVDEMTKHLREGLRPDVSRIQPAIAALLVRCWAQDPDERPSAQELCDLLPSLKDEIRLSAKCASKAPMPAGDKSCSLQ
jgi:serine/threonine protein kinase